MAKMRWIGAAVAVALMSLPSAAFQEQQVGGAKPKAAAPLQVQPVVPNVGAGGGVQLSTPDAAPGSGKGTEVRIPGLGKLGVLPKLDFGLDILYGATDDRRREEGPASSRSDDVTVQGTIKHRF
jgi:hypothetical protein